MTRSKTLTALASALAIASPAPAAAAGPPRYCGPDSAESSIGSNDSMERETLQRLNAIRREHGMRELRSNSRLRAAAMAHARDMLSRRYFAHFGPNGDPWSARIRRSGYLARHGSWTIGQNIAWGRYQCRAPRGVVYMWMHSPPHRHVILTGRFRDVGIAVVDGAPVPVQGPASTYVANFGVKR
jgi:uncharacterized protein YkwD